MKLEITRKGLFKFCDGSTVLSSHIAVEEAFQEAGNAAFANPGKVYTVQPPAGWEVVAKGAALAPGPEPTPAPEPAPVPPPTSLGTLGVTHSVSGTAVTLTLPDGRQRHFSGARIVHIREGSSGTGSELDPASPDVIADAPQPHTIYMLRGEIRGDRARGWGRRNFAFGRRHSDICLLGYPGEGAQLYAPSSTSSCFSLRDGSETTPSNLWLVGLTMVGGSACVNGGGVTVGGGEIEKSGALNLVVAGCDLRAIYAAGVNTMTGLVTVQNDGALIVGNQVHDTGSGVPINNNHAIYVQCGASNVEVAWNELRNLVMGHVIQVHTDSYFLYTGIRIHHNRIVGAAITDCRGINAGNLLLGSSGEIYDNELTNLGQSFSAIALWSGQWRVHGNTLDTILADPAIWISGGARNEVSAEVYENRHRGLLGELAGVVQGASPLQLVVRDNHPL